MINTSIFEGKREKLNKKKFRTDGKNLTKFFLISIMIHKKQAQICSNNKKYISVLFLKITTISS